jgi:tyrosyl-tRNA synthetase
MSKSLGNYISVTENPEDMFGKTMRIPDELMPSYYSLLLDRSLPKVEPNEQKRALAHALVRTFHGEEAAARAERIFYARARREIPEDIVEVPLPLYPSDTLFPGSDVYSQSDKIWIVDLITHAGFANTNGEARRFIRGGAVRLDGEVVTDETLQIPKEELDGKILQVGKRRYARLVAPR